MMDDDLLNDVDTSILNVVHVTRTKTERKEIEDVAKRKPCLDFERYEGLFAKMRELIKNKEVLVSRFKNKAQVNIGDFFILGNLLCYVDSIIEETDEPQNPRYRIIFDNGVESNHLRQSLIRALYKDPLGKQISLLNNDPTGYIYILGSESKAPALERYQAHGQLVKIGFTTQSVQERIKNAESDPTYLEAPVKLLAEIECFNLNPQKYENLIHSFLADQRLRLTMTDSKGRVYQPSEWFTVDAKTAIQVAELIINGLISHYRMDNTTNQLKRKD